MSVVSSSRGARSSSFALVAAWAVTAAFALVAGCTSSTALRSDNLPTAISASPTGEYLIGPGDTLTIFVWREPELNVTIPVRPDGRLSSPLVEDMVAVGKTSTQLSRDIEAVLSEFIRSPQVNVIVQGFVGVSGAQVRVLGQAAQPMSIPYRERMTMMDVIIEVGGLTDFAAGNRTRVVRTVEGESQEIRVRLDDLIRRGEIEHNMLMQPGDVVIIPEALF